MEMEMEDKVFYIVGKITGDENYKTKFYNAYKFLTEKQVMIKLFHLLVHLTIYLMSVMLQSVSDLYKLAIVSLF